MKLTSPVFGKLSTALLLFSLLMVCAARAQFRTWKDQAGNSIKAELINKDFGGKVVIRDKKGKVYKLDPARLSKEDQLYLNPPAPKYSISLSKRTAQVPQDNQRHGHSTLAYAYNFALKVKFMTDDPVPQGLKGRIFIMGKDETGDYVVITKVDGHITDGQLETEECTLSTTKGGDGLVLQSIKYDGFLILLLDGDGKVLDKKYTAGFLADHEKVLALSVGDRFNNKLEKIKKDAE